MNDKPNGLLKPYQFILLILALIGSVIGGVVLSASQISEAKVEISHLKEQAYIFNDFMIEGDRWTLKDGKRLESDLKTLENEVRGYPPAWFRDNFKTLSLDVKDIKKNIEDLTVAVRLLESKIELP